MNLITQEELTLLTSDSKYKTYSSNIEKCLKNFESSSEWADLIQSLNKLKKVLQTTKPQYQYIPKRISICKRLSQCLHPALPGGVHANTLEVYAVIFSIIGTDNLSRDIFLYSSGLFPLLEYAGLNVKPKLLDLYEKYFLPLKQSLKPCLTGFILALLPGLEEGSEFYQRTYNLLNNICQHTTPAFFYTCMWSAMICSSTIRFPAIQFILAHLDKRKLMEDQLFLIGNSIDTMISSICCCLQDTNTLVQRSTLDLLLSMLPMYNNQITREDKIKLIKIAVHLVLRRDMSLNRRLYAWLLGQDSNGNQIKLPKHLIIDNIQQQQPQLTSQHSIDSEKSAINNIYFVNFSKNLLITSIKSLLNSQENTQLIIIDHEPQQQQQQQSNCLKMLKIISNLIEKQEIGQVIVEDVLLDLLVNVYYEYKSSNLTSTNHHNSTHHSHYGKDKPEPDINKALSNFIFQSFQSNFIWEFCANKFHNACKSYINDSENDNGEHLIGADYKSMPDLLCDLYLFILDLGALDVYTEIQTEYLPIMLQSIITTLNTYCDHLTNHDLTKSLKLCSKILKKVVPKNIASYDVETINTDCTDSLTLINEAEIEMPTKRTNDYRLDDEIDDEKIKLIVKESLNDIIDIIECVHESVNIVNDGENYVVTEQPFDNNSPSLTTIKVSPDDEDRVDSTTTTRPPAVKSHTLINDNEIKCNDIIYNCIKCLKQFVHKFIYSNIFDANYASSNDVNDINRLYFNALFHRYYKNMHTTIDFDNELHNELENIASKIHIKQTSNEFLSSFKQLNKFLIRLFLFPRGVIQTESTTAATTGNNNGNSTASSNQSPNQQQQNDEFEEWLKDLFVISCLYQTKCDSTFFEFQSISINTLLELFFISQTYNSNQTSRFKHTRSTAHRHSDSNVGILLITTVFTNKQMELIYNQSFIGYLIGQKLWAYLDANMHYTQLFQCQKKAATLFCLLHEILPNTLCEDIISKSLTGDEQTQLDTIKRFINLWHWSKEMQNENCGSLNSQLNGGVSITNIQHMTKTFERCVLMILDLLDKSSISVNKLIQEWLSKSIYDGDLCRIFDILIVCLMHSSTSRVSIQYFVHNNEALSQVNSTNVNRNSKENQDNEFDLFESKVYAISHEKGNVVYHVNNETTERLRSNTISTPQQSSLILASLPDMSKLLQSTGTNASTGISSSNLRLNIKPIKHAHVELPSSITNASTIQQDKISLRVNPFVLEPNDKFNALNGTDYVDLDDSDSYMKRTVSESNFLEKIRAKKIDIEQQQQQNDKKSRITKSPTTNTQTSRHSNETGDELDFVVETPTTQDYEDLTSTLHSTNSITTFFNECYQNTDTNSKHDLIDDNFAYMLLYNQLYDHTRTIFLLSCIDKLLKYCKKDFLFALCKTKIRNQNIQSIHNKKLNDLITRHIKSIYGHNYYSNEQLTNEFQVFLNQSINFQSITYIELLINLLLFYVRSYCITSSMFQNTPAANAGGTKQPAQDQTTFKNGIYGNENVKISCLRLLMKIIQELTYLCQNTNTNGLSAVLTSAYSGKPTTANNLATIFNDDTVSFNQHIFELMDRCKLQKTLLHCLYSLTVKCKQKSITKFILDVNQNNVTTSNRYMKYTFSCELINCIQYLVQLEHVLCLNVTVKPPTQKQLNEQLLSDDFLLTKSKVLNNNNNNNSTTSTNSQGTDTTRYVQNVPIIGQSMFVSSIYFNLRNLNTIEFHIPILNLVQYSLPYTGSSLKSISTFVIKQLCSNLKEMISLYEDGHINSLNHKDNFNVNVKRNEFVVNIPDFMILILKKLIYFLHYCLVISNNNLTTTSNNNNNINGLNNLNKINNNEANLIQDEAQKGGKHVEHDSILSLIDLLPTILADMTYMWRVLTHSESFGYEQNSWFLGHPEIIKHHITELLGPIAYYHGNLFTKSVGKVWGDLRRKSKSALFEQKTLIELIKSLKNTYPITIIIQNITELIKSSSDTKDKKKSFTIIWLLQFFNAYHKDYLQIKAINQKKIHETNDKREKIENEKQYNEFFVHLCAFFKDSLTQSSMQPSAYFQIFKLLHDSVTDTNNQTLVDDKKYSKDIQDAAHKLVELCNTFVGLSLQQTTWLRRNIQVKLVTSKAVHDNTTNSNNVEQNDNQNNPTDDPLSDTAHSASEMLINDTESNEIHSFQALNVLAEYLAKTLDIVYKSDEKDRLVVPILYNVMNNIWPFLKTHVEANKKNFIAASQILMNLTGYPYTRKTWKKEVFDILFDSSFFLVDSAALYHWKVIIDNLLTNDRNDRSMFRDVIVRVTYTQSSGLFTSREQEAEQRSQLLKRLAFVIYASDKDQYVKNMHEIQECIAQMLKVVQSTNLYSTLFLLFRVLLLRISSKNLVALWPTILSELLLILMQLEQDLQDEIDASRSSKPPSILEALTYPSINLNNLTQNNSVKLSVYLSACKLIDLILTLPYSLTAQFQLYKWSFLGSSDQTRGVQNGNVRDNFIPYLTRIAEILKTKHQNHKTPQYKPSGTTIIKQRQIQSFIELKPFFDIITSESFQTLNSTLQQTSNLKYFEQTIHEDFVDGWI